MLDDQSKDQSSVLTFRHEDGRALRISGTADDPVIETGDMSAEDALHFLATCLCTQAAFDARMSKVLYPRLTCP